MITNLVALTVGLASTASAFTCTGNYFSFYNRGGNAMTYGRLDPILQPGTQSPHMHSFDGANVVSATTDYANTQGATCTTARLKQDKSIYWRPTLYWNGNGTGFHRVPEQATKIYYKYGDGASWANVTEFPGDFNMLVGYPDKRADGDNPAGVRWGCHTPDGRSDPIFANGFPTGFQSCDYGFASEVTFPSCWNGNKLNPASPYDHMAYPLNTGVGLENCPTTHRAARFPTIFIEFWYDVSSFNKQYASTNKPWVLSNGDPTGYSFHADFLNGWEKGVLGKATGETNNCNCGCGCGQEQMEQCFGKENVNNDSDPSWASCDQVIASDSSETGALVQKLPGCNPIQAGPASATKVTSAGCDATAVAGSKGPNSSSSAAAAASHAAASATSAPSSAAAVSSAVAASSRAVKDDANTHMSVTMSFGNKGQAGGYLTATPAAASSQRYGTAPSVSLRPAGDKLPSLSLVATPHAGSKPTGSGSGSGSGSPAGGPAAGDCKTVTVTITPTIYVTAGTNTTSCGSGTVTQTMTHTATITVPASGGMNYGSY
ncbi:hypothetical protein ACEQ8H_003084 [Pleosporales sp. CAS-2024a]